MTITTTAENIIKEYIHLLMQEYEFDEDALLQIWKNSHPNDKTYILLPNLKISTDNDMFPEKNIQITELSNVNLDDDIDMNNTDVEYDITENNDSDSSDNKENTLDEGNDIEQLKSKKKTELQTMCKDLKLPYSGTKDVLIERLSKQKKITSFSKNSSNEQVNIKKSKSSKKTKFKIPNVLQKLLTERPVINLRRNKHNNFEHLETGFVFNEITQIVKGKQSDDGNILPINEQDMELCKEYGFSFTDYE
jgi:hypothetical protein